MTLKKLVLFIHILQEICAKKYVNSCHKHVVVAIPKSADCSIFKIFFCEKADEIMDFTGHHKD